MTLAELEDLYEQYPFLTRPLGTQLQRSLDQWQRSEEMFVLCQLLYIHIRWRTIGSTKLMNMAENILIELMSDSEESFEEWVKRVLS